MPLFSDKVKYALDAMVELARVHDDLVQVEVLSKKHAIPRTYLVQIMQVMQAAGLVSSQRGPGGGYKLAKAPASISALDIIHALDGTVTPVSGGKSTSITDRFWQEVTTRFAAALDASLADIVAALPGDQYSI